MASPGQFQSATTIIAVYAILTGNRGAFYCKNGENADLQALSGVKGRPGSKTRAFSARPAPLRAAGGLIGDKLQASQGGPSGTRRAGLKRRR